MDNKVKHLEMIQGIVNRMSINSFLLKGWSVVLVSGLFALAAKDCNPFFAYLAFFNDPIPTNAGTENQQKKTRLIRSRKTQKQPSNRIVHNPQNATRVQLK